MRRTVGVLAAIVLVGAACAGPSTVETSVRDAFVACMEEQGIAVDDVEVVVRTGRHIETFSWQPADDDTAEDAGQQCEDAALQQFQVSRT